MPGLTLALDASASTGTIAVLRDDLLVAERSVAMRSSAEERFFPAVLDALREAGAAPSDVARIVCGAGPGSFTSLRVVGAIAKGIAVGADRPLFGVPSLALIVASSSATKAGGRWMATLDAMRGDRYCALVTVEAGGEVTAVESLGLAPAAACAARADALGARLIGPDETLPGAPHARGVTRCLALVSAVGAVDVAAWEPVYGRLAEAQVKWEAAHGRALAADRDLT